MIINISLENWMSFYSPVTFSMVASRERQHGERVPRVNKYQTRVLPVAAIYGGNASGKTNFFKALHFTKNLVVEGTRIDSLIPVEPYRLNAKGIKEPSRLSFELLIDEIIYEFSFVVTSEAVLEEKLVQINSTSEKTLYARANGKIKFDSSFNDDMFLQFAFKGTRDNQFFLTNSVSQKVETFLPVFNWFKDTLELVAPDSRFEPFEEFIDEGQPLYATMNEMLPQLDTGITHLGGEVVSFESIILPEAMRLRLQKDVKEGMTVRLTSMPNNDRFLISRKKGNIVARKLVTYHPRSDGDNIKFEMRQESDGSQRIIDLLPAFLDISCSSKVYVIDEVDRSLHTLLTRQLLNYYLESCSPDSRSQLLFTTHDVLLMDQQLFRRDEMWVAERNNTGVSNLFSFSEYKDVRYDKDIRKSYLQGRMGGVPRIFMGGSLVSPCVNGPGD